MKKTYKDFKAMMLLVAKDIVESHKYTLWNGQKIKINVTCSGGLDSLSTVIALKHFTDDINLIHWNRGRGRYDDTLTKITMYVADKYGLGLQMVDVGDDVYSDLYKAGVKRFVFSDGFDIAFSEIYEIYPDTPGYPYGKTLSFSYGEWFRSRHPVLDVLLHLPDRLSAWRSSRTVSGYERLMSNIYLDKKYRDREIFDIDVIDYDSHPLFIDFFREYYTPFSDVFSRKRFCQLFIKDMTGMTHQQIIRRATR